MCGIAGFMTKNPELHELELMLMMISHRGPDELGTYIDSQAALGAARLAIVDLKDGKQPMMSESGDVVLVFNGEIFNYIELMEQLKKEGHTFRTHSDSEVLLKGYLEYGHDFAHYLNGQFAIGIWDLREQKLILARDRVGIRPLFYQHSSQIFSFGSEIKTLLTRKGTHKEINKQALDQIFTFWTPVGSHTMFKGIKELPPGNMLIYQNNTVQINSYWQWPFPSLHEKKTSSLHETQEQFLEKLKTSVTLNLRADVEVGAYLSGGIDSSSIVALSSKIAGERLQTFSIAFKEESYDERPYQKTVSDLFKTRHQMIECDYPDIEKHFKEVIWHTEMPIFRTAPAPLFLLSDYVRSKKIKVVLTGEGADEILLGYDLFRQVKLRKFWSRQPASKRRPLLFKKLYAYLPQFNNERYANLAIQSFKQDLSTSSPFYSHLIRFNNNIANKVFYSQELRMALGDYSAYDELLSILPADYFKVDEIDQAQYLEMTTLLRGYLLSSQGDRMSMAHGVEGRYPFLDHEFIEFVNTLPRKFKLSGLKDKLILREVFSRFLPEEIARRPKVAYQSPEVRPFIRIDQTISSLIEQYLNTKAIDEAGLYAGQLVHSLVKKVQDTDLIRLGTRDNTAFVEVLSTQIFYDSFINSDLRQIAEEKLKDNKIPFSVRINKKQQYVSA